jgi:hypothetical protein
LEKQCLPVPATLVAVGAPDLTQKAIEQALTPKGHKDRELIWRLWWDDSMIHRGRGI